MIAAERHQIAGASRQHEAIPGIGEQPRQPHFFSINRTNRYVDFSG
jgi:hypothetical protein